MKPDILLKTSSAIMLLHTIGHTIGAISWRKPATPAIGNVIEGMINNSFTFMGRVVTIASFYEGYGYTLIAVLLFLSIFLWMLAGEVSLLTKKLLLPLALLLALFGIVEWRYFFPLAAVMSTGAAILAFIAYYQMGKMILNGNRSGTV